MIIILIYLIIFLILSCALLSKLPQSAKYIVDMTAPFSKEELVAALRSTFIGNSESLRQTTAYFADVSKKTGKSPTTQGFAWR